MVSHELRTPLSPVLMAVAAAESDPVVAGRVQRELETIRRNVALQVRLIDDLLDIAKVAHGKLPLNLVKLNLHDPLNAAINSCSGGLQDKKLSLRQDFAAAKHCVYGDADRLQQVFWNLLRNAIKFTPEGGWIAVRTFNQLDWLIVEVADNGQGIEKHRLGTIFTAFEQGDEEVTRRFGGLGLGLSICSALVNAHDSTISAQSDGPGKGAVFTVRLPVL
jgi:signal transduction histidine kinase